MERISLANVALWTGASAALAVGGAAALVWRSLRASEAPTGGKPWTAFPVRLPACKERLLFSLPCWGSRGDVQPVLLLAQQLLHEGHDVRIALPSEFAGMAVTFGLGDHLLAYEFPMDMDAMASRTLTDPMGAFQEFFLHLDKLFAAFSAAAEGADVLVCQWAPFVTQISLMLAEHHRMPIFFTAHDPMVLPSPHSYFKADGSGASSLFHIKTISTMFGFFGHEQLNDIRERLAMPPVPRFNQAVPLPRMWACPTLITYPCAVAPYEGGPAWYHQAGPWIVRDAAASDQDVDEALQAFVEAGEPPIYIGFGSWSAQMVPDAEQKAAFTKCLYAALAASYCRAVVLAGTTSTDVEAPASVFVSSFLPHKWLFPRCKGVVHHGGAGTSILGLSCGRPTIVIPPTPLQEPWGRMLEACGAGFHVGRKAILQDCTRVLTDRFRGLSDAAVVETAAKVGAEVAEECSRGLPAAVAAMLEDLAAVPRE